jgi:cytochrome oxidase assembly protein ShyY1
MIGPLLRTRRWIGFTVLVAVSITAFGVLSAWQWSRAEDRRSERESLQAASAAAPVAVTDATRAGLEEWTAVDVSGTYASEQVVVRKRPFQARNGFWVMAPLRHSSGTIWVNRGWIPVSADALATPDIPPPPAGIVEVSGYLRSFEDADPSDNDGLPERQVAAPAPALLPDVGADPGGYLQARTSQPVDDAVIALPPPEIDEGRNISYAVQWALFALVAICGWYYFLRREAREDVPAAPPADTDPSDAAASDAAAATTAGRAGRAGG